MYFGLIDFLVLFAYLIGVAVFGLWVSRGQRSNEEYFLGGSGIPWWAVLFSVVATETSTLTFISIPAVAYGGNLTFLQITFGYFLGRIVVALLFLPKYYQGELFTAYQFLEKRFGASMRNATSTTFIITRVLADGVRLFATAIPLAVLFRLGGAFSGWGDAEIYILSIVVIASVTLLYTFFGGIKAVVWMDVVQMFVYLGGAIVAACILIYKLPEGWNTLQLIAAQEQKFRIFDFGTGLSFKEFIAQPYTFFTAVIGGAVFTLASHGTDQLIVQRLMATRNLKNGQKALIWSGAVVVLQFALFLFIGLLLYAFYAGSSAAGLGLATDDEIFAKFIVEQLPAGIAGLIIAALFAAAMSSLSSSLNSLASSTMYDLYKPYFGTSNSAKRDLKISRIITVLWGTVLTGSAFLFTWLQLRSGERPAIVELGLGIASYTYGGLLGAFALGILFKSPDKTDALIGFFSGLAVLFFLVNGSAQTFFFGTNLVLAWPLYTVVGSLTVVLVGLLSREIRTGIFAR